MADLINPPLPVVGSESDDPSAVRYEAEWTDEGSSSTGKLQPFHLHPLNPYRFYNTSKLYNSIKAVLPTRPASLTAVYKSSTVSVQTVSTSNQETYLPVLSERELKQYRSQGYKGLHLGAICLGLQPTFLAGKNVTCLVALLDTRWNKFEDALITAVEAGLHNGHVLMRVEPNFTLDLTKTSLANTIQVMIQVHGVDMQPGETILALHHSMTYKVQTHLFSMDHDSKPKISILGDATITQPQIHTKHHLTFPPSWKCDYEKKRSKTIIHDAPKIQRIQPGRISLSFPSQTAPEHPCEVCQLQGKSPKDCPHALRRSLSQKPSRFVFSVSKASEEMDLVQYPEDYFQVGTTDAVSRGQWLVQRTRPEDVGPIEAGVNWANMNAKAQNKAINQIWASQTKLHQQQTHLHQMITKEFSDVKQTLAQALSPNPIQLGGAQQRNPVKPWAFSTPAQVNM